jgi:hypothetical protein
LRIPANLSPEELSAALSNGGYAVTKQTPHHVRLTTLLRGEHHVTFPRDQVLDIRTTSAVLGAVAAHHRLSLAEMSERLF